jgi:hypothetical protein
MPTLLTQRKAVSGSDRYCEVVLGSPESIAQGMLPKGLSRNPRELPIPFHTERNNFHTGRYATPRDNRRGRGKVAEQSYNLIVPVKVGNRRASERSGHGTHWREGGSKRTPLLRET